MIWSEKRFQFLIAFWYTLLALLGPQYVDVDTYTGVIACFVYNYVTY